MTQHYKNTFSCRSRSWHFAMVTALILSLTACASGPQPEQDPAAAADAQSTPAQATTDVPAADSASADSVAADTASATTEPKSEVVVEKIAPPKIVESCKKEPYVNFEKQARDSIGKGWESTKAEQYGVGFRDAEEYKKWSATHKVLFAKVSELCQSLSDCAKDNAKEKDVKCADLAQRYSLWQKTAEDFAGRIKAVESTQPPELCSMAPALEDSGRCFHDRATQLNGVCKSEECKAAATCWDGIYFLDVAKLQAEQACQFAHLPLDKCRGYVESTMRRKGEFEQCKKMQDGLGLELPPVL